MGKKLKPFSLRKHRETGKFLAGAYNAFLDLILDLGSAYGKTKSMARRAERIADEINTLRAELDNYVDSNDVYYPKEPKRKP
jgi:hypothetical protein